MIGRPAVRLRFDSAKLERLYTKEEGVQKYPSEVVDAFFDVMGQIYAAVDERDLYALKSLHFEKLKGSRGNAGDRSLRLNDKWRLIVRLERDQQGRLVAIIRIENHYRR